MGGRWLTPAVAGALIVGVPLGVYADRMSRQVDQQQTQIEQLEKPDLPVSVRARRAIFGQGYVVLIHNNIGQTLSVRVTVSRAGVDPRILNMVINPNGLQELGQRQGWAFAPGDSLRMANPRFRDWVTTGLSF